MSKSRVRTWNVRSSRDLAMAAREIRLSKETEQKDVASNLGLDPTYLSKLESGKRTSVLLDRLLRLFRFYGAEVTVTWTEDSDA